MNIPLFIVRKNKYFYVDTKTGKFIHKSKIGAYVTELKRDRDKEIQNKRWDLKLE